MHSFQTTITKFRLKAEEDYSTDLHGSTAEEANGRCERFLELKFRTSNEANYNKLA